MSKVRFLECNYFNLFRINLDYTRRLCTDEKFSSEYKF